MMYHSTLTARLSHSIEAKLHVVYSTGVSRFGTV